MTANELNDLISQGRSLEAVALSITEDGSTQEEAQKIVARAQAFPMGKLSKGTTAQRETMTGTDFQQRFYDTDLELFLTFNGNVWLTETGVNAAEF